MKIGSNNSILASRNLASTSQAIARALERLSTGRRINSPQDGVSDYKTSLRLDSQIRGLSQAVLGINQGLGMSQMAEAALSNQLGILQNMRSLAVEASNGTLSFNDRKSLDSEFQSLKAEFDRITDRTTFDDIHLLNDDLTSVYIQAGSDAGDGFQISMPDLSDLEFSAEQTTIDQDGTFSSGSTITDSGGLQDAELGDIDGDDIDDLVFLRLDDNDLVVRTGNGNGTFGAATTYDVTNELEEVELADLNGDNDLDVVVQSENGASGQDVWIFTNDGSGTLSATQTFNAGTNTNGLTIGDLNSDGELDIINTSLNGEYVQFFFGNGDGTFGSVQSFQIPNNPSDTAIGDIDGDGDVDIAVVDEGSNRVRIYENDGSENFSSSVNFFRSGMNPKDAVLRDFDNDGNLDVAFTTDVDDTVTVHLGNGDGTFASEQSYSVTNPYDLEILDIDGDGYLDILTGSSTENQLTIFSNDGDGTFTLDQTYATGAVPDFLAAGDINGDTVTDIVTSNVTDDSFSAFTANATVETTLQALSLTEQSLAEASISQIDHLLESLQESRGEIAGNLNRLNIAFDHAVTQSETLRRAQSDILDTDFALETARLVQNQILQQAQVAVAAQANVQLQIVLGLFNFE